MQMPMGKFAGQPVKSMSTAFLCWVTSQDHIRFARPTLVEHIVGVLAERFQDPGAVLAELRVAAEPPARWRTADAANETRRKPAARRRQADSDVSDLV